MNRPGVDSEWASRPNVLRDAAPPNVLRQSERWSGAPSDIPGPPISRGPAMAAVLLVAILFIGSVAVRMFEEPTTQEPATPDACAQVESLLSDPAREAFNAEPADWMPTRVAEGYQLTLDRGTSLEIVALSRVNPEESRIELARDGFRDGHEREWDSSIDHVSFDAQRFFTVEGALAFQAYANRYACQFANEAFRGPRGSIGLQIRFESGRIGEQVSWVSGTTRVIVFVTFDVPPPDHARVESLVELIPIR